MMILAGAAFHQRNPEQLTLFVPPARGGEEDPAVVVRSRVARGHHAVTRSALDAARRLADSGAQGARRWRSQGFVPDTWSETASTPLDGSATLLRWKEDRPEVGVR